MSNLLEPGTIEVELKDLYLDPNNPRLALSERPGYQNIVELFDETKQDEIFKTVIDGNHDITSDGLVNTILGVGWEDLAPIVVWQPEGIKGKYLVVEGNRRTTSLKYIHGTEHSKLKKRYDKAKVSTVPSIIQELPDIEEDLKRAENVINQTKKIFVKKMVAKTDEDLREDLPKLLSIIHLNGPKDWENFAQAKFIFETYVNFWQDTNGKISPVNKLNWEDPVERKTQNYCNIKTLSICRQTLRSYSWFEDFKEKYAEDLPADCSFKNKDYFLFEMISSGGGKFFREEILGVKPPYNITLPVEATDAIFEWSFKEPRTTRATNDKNIFSRHQMVKELGDLNREGSQRNPPFRITCYDIENLGTARRFDEVRLEYENTAASTEAPNIALSKVRSALEELRGTDFRIYGEEVKHNLVSIKGLTEDYIKMIDAIS